MTGVDFDRSAEPGMQWRVRVELLETEAYRQTLDDLHPVAGGVLGRQQREGQPGAGAEALDLSVKDDVGIGVDLNGCLLAGPHMSELGLLEIGLDPNPVG